MTQGNGEVKTDPSVQILLVVANVMGIGIGYAITVVLARHLTSEGFEQYIGTIATIGLTASLAEAGFGKYGLKIVPVFVVNNLANMLRGYMWFSFWGCLLSSFLIGFALLALEERLLGDAGERMLLQAVWFLPAMAGLGVAVDLLIAYRMAGWATLIARILVPGTTLALIVAAINAAQVTPQIAVVCFGLASLTGLCLAFALCLFKTVPLVRNATADTQFREWVFQGSSFLAFGFLTSWIFKAPLILAHHMPHRANELALLAPAFETGCLILLISKSTDKYFQPAMSVIIELGDWATGMTVRKSRFWLVGSGVVIFLSIIFMFGKKILGVYGSQFTDAYSALCIIAVGSSCWTLFSLAPSFLLFVGERKTLTLNLLFHGLLMIALTILLFDRYGLNGIAFAYAVSISSLALVNRYLADAYIRRVGSELPES